MRIRVLTNFGGRLTRENRIPPGEYEDDNPLLWGLAWYLIEAGHAVEIEGLPEHPEEPSIEVESTPEPTEFSIPEFAEFISRDGDIITYKDKLNGIMTLNAITGETRSTGKHPPKHRK